MAGSAKLEQGFSLHRLFRTEVVHAVSCLAVALSYLRISGVAREGGGVPMFWLLLTSIAAGLFANWIIKATRGGSYLPDVDDVEES